MGRRAIGTTLLHGGRYGASAFSSKKMGLKHPDARGRIEGEGPLDKTQWKTGDGMEAEIWFREAVPDRKARPLGPCSDYAAVSNASVCQSGTVFRPNGEIELPGGCELTSSSSFVSLLGSVLAITTTSTIGKAIR